MNTNEYKILFCIKVNKQLVKLGKYFADFNFCGLRLTAKYRVKLDDAKISHFTVYKHYFFRNYSTQWTGTQFEFDLYSSNVKIIIKLG